MRSVGNSPATKATIFIPLVGYLILFNENLLHYVELSRELFGAHNSHAAPYAQVSLRLLSVYFGLSLIAVASVIYAVWCPQQVKTFDSPSAYIAGTADNISFLEIGEIELALRSQDSLAKGQLDDLKDYDDRRGVAESLEEFRHRRVETEAAVLDLHFQQLNRSHPKARTGASVAYGIGFVALGIPSLDVFGRVSLMLIRSLIGWG